MDCGLIKHFHQRIECPRCGVYDRKLEMRPEKTLCDYCGKPADVMQWCRCWSLEVELPWMNQPTKGFSERGYAYGRNGHRPQRKPKPGPGRKRKVREVVPKFEVLRDGQILPFEKAEAAKA